MVVSPDVGGVVRARALAKRLDDADLAIIDKRRPRPNEAKVMNIIGDVRGRCCVLDRRSGRYRRHPVPGRRRA
jgi:ribose-phosphate pyrophosphokinase